MATLRIDTGDLAYAMGDHDTRWVLDLRTGNVLMEEWAKREPDGDPAEAEWDPEFEPDEVELDPERFRYVEPLGSHEGFRWMERFAAAQSDDHVRDRLLRVLDQRRPFRGFKDALANFPAVREAWFTYENDRLVQAARDWLEVEGIDAELMDKHAADAAVNPNEQAR